jgi:type III secretion protein U
MSEKTEPPTQKKLRDARKKGQVAKSKEVASAALIAVVFAMLTGLMSSYLNDLGKMITAPTAFYEAEFGIAAGSVMQDVLMTGLKIVLPIVLVVAAVGAIAHMAQSGLLMAAQSIKPDLKKLNPASGVKKIFALKNFFEFLKSAVKIAFLSTLLFIVIRSWLPELVKIPYCGVGCIPEVLSSILFDITIFTVAAFVIIAAADFVYQKWQFTKEQKMTKDEVKREYKESEGDPHIKGKRKQFHQELMQANEESAVRRSKVVVTNPTHIAVALEYREGETPLPIIAAMGKNLNAKRIIRIAEEEEIPIYENVPLAHALNDDGQLGNYIPVELIDEVAEVLRWVYDMEQEQEMAG